MVPGRRDSRSWFSHILRSRLRYWIASAMCDASMFSAPARSAMVRPTFNTRLYARALNPSLLIAVSNKSLRVFFHCAVALDFPGAHLRVGVNFSFVESLQLNRSRLVDASRESTLEALAGVFAGELLIAQAGDFDLDIDAIEQRAGDFRAVALDLQRRADAFLLRIGKKSADARIHRRDQHEARGIIDRTHGARDGNVAIFQRLAHDFENVAAKLRQLVEEKHAVVGERDFARAWAPCRRRPDRHRKSCGAASETAAWR